MKSEIHAGQTSDDSSGVSLSPSSPWPSFDEEQIEAVARVLRSGRVNYWTGNEGRQLEADYASFCDCRHAIALANGTVALELALYALGIGPGDEVIVPSRTFIASASCVVARGGRPVCADVARDSQTVTHKTIEEALTPRTKAIIAVHLAGWPCDMYPILDLAESRGLAVIEDCAQAHGAEYQGRPVGSLGDVGVFSFCQDKIISTGGEGGMLVTNRTDLWDRAWRYKDHGKTTDAFYRPEPPGTKFRWLHDGFGTNMRMTEMQSALGRIALRRLPEWISARHRNAEQLVDACRPFSCVRTPVPPAHVQHAYYKHYCFLKPKFLDSGWDRDRLLAELRSAGVNCSVGSCSEIYLENAFPKAWRPTTRLPTAKELGETSLMFPVHPTFSQEEIRNTCDGIQKVLQQATQSNRRAA